MEWSEDQNNSVYPALIGIVALVLMMTVFFNAGQLAEVAAAGTQEPHRITVPQGTPIVVRLDHPVSTANSGAEFMATVTEPVMVSGVVVIPSGAHAKGVVVSGSKHPRWSLSSIEARGRSYEVAGDAGDIQRQRFRFAGRARNVLTPADTQLKFSLQQAAQVQVAAW
jgi:hypothetical protein